MAVSTYVDIVFDGPPGASAPRFVETENDKGASIKLGEWIDLGNDFWVLRITPESLLNAVDPRG